MGSIQVQQDKTTGRWFVYYARDDGGDSGMNVRPGQPLGLRIDSLVTSRDKLPKDDKTLLIPKTPSDPNQMFTFGGKKGLVTIAKDVWSFDDATRARVRANFDDFLVKLEALEGDLLVPGATNFVRRELAMQLPATFDELLYFFYGFSRQGASGQQCYIDLQAGMRLRIDHEISQFVSPAAMRSGNDALVNGYVSAGQSYYHLVETLGSDNRPQIGFDPFLAANALSLTPPGLGGAAGLIDLHAIGRRRYVRLCYPAQFQSADSSGYIGPRQNVTLIGANDLSTLTAATQAYYRDGSAGGLTALPGASMVFFRGRVIVVPELLCFVTSPDTPWFVPIGTTMRQIVQRIAPLPRLPGLDIGGNFQLRRYIPTTQIGDNPQFRDDYENVNIARSTGTALVDGYDVPILTADFCKFPSAGS